MLFHISASIPLRRKGGVLVNKMFIIEKVVMDIVSLYDLITNIGFSLQSLIILLLRVYIYSFRESLFI